MTKESVQQLLCHCSCHLVVTTPMEHIENRTSHSQSSSSNFKTPKRTTIMRQHLAQVVILLLLGAIDCHPHIGSNNRLPAEFANHHPRHQTTDDPAFRVFYGTGVSLTRHLLLLFLGGFSLEIAIQVSCLDFSDYLSISPTLHNTRTST